MKTTLVATALLCHFSGTPKRSPALEGGLFPLVFDSTEYRVEVLGNPAQGWISYSIRHKPTDTVYESLVRAREARGAMKVGAGKGFELDCVL